jgi:L-aminopeptidase/D-esterase-like protein
MASYDDDGGRTGQHGEALAGLGVAGVRVGHWTDQQSQTGCTVVELPAGTVASYEARGGAPASREVELLSRAITPPHTRFDGDAFIAAATGEVDAHVDAVRFLALTATCRAIRSVQAYRSSR